MDEKYTTIHYHSYLELDKILDAQHPRSEDIGVEAHDETLFIIIHQVYELWFKQIIHELKSVMEMFRKDNVDERSIGTAVSRLGRIIEIQELLVKQIRVLETMTPLDFLDFRDFLFPASGFQSFQFRKLEVMLGLENDDRVSYHAHHFTKSLKEDQAGELLALDETPSFLELIEDWLERTPFLQFGDFEFKSAYEGAVERMLQRETISINASSYLSDDEKQKRLRMLGDSNSYFRAVLDEEHHKALVDKGEIHLSYRAMMAALLIRLYRDEPILHLPHLFIARVMEMDENFTLWRYRHAQMVLRMLGKKVGTGGSSGHEYLLKTAMTHQIFKDFHNISTLLIPRSELPELPYDLKRMLGYYYTDRE